MHNGERCVYTAKLTGRNVYELASELRKITNSVNAIKQVLGERIKKKYSCKHILERLCHVAYLNAV